VFPIFDTQQEPRPPDRSVVRNRSTRVRSEASLDAHLTVSLANAERVVFLDVETTGLSWFYDEITIIGWARNGIYKVLLKGDDPQPLLADLAAADVLVTFNGTLFDLRFLKKAFGDLRLPATHIDLRYLAKRVELSGGQKNIERVLGIVARDGVENIDGAAAVLLWHAFLRGNQEALMSLIDYNRRDVLAMSEILDAVLERLEVHPHLWLAPPRFGAAARAALAHPLPTIVVRARELRTFRNFQSQFQGTGAESATIIGIDLTGSERRASGWCILRGNIAETTTINTDQDMIDRVIAERPTLVSIDSPLSLPFGRVSVDDADPGREEFGIMRRCERELRRRGINVYPSLLPSMQGLTKRGITLAERLRREGIAVIESYPGAAQDIMGIPRKGAGEEYLKRGLVEFGVEGSFAHSKVSHDELDAITSALVGSFFLAGQFEAMRGPSEGALIIPDLSRNGPDGMVIGISGKICAGKTTAARILERRGFAYTRFSLVIDDEILSRGEVPSRATRQRVGTEIHTNKGQRWLCERVLDRVAEQPFIVIDGLRFPEDHAFFVERFGSKFVHLHLDAPDAIREKRYAESTRDDLSFGDANKQPVEAEIDRLSGLATKVIGNLGTINDLENAVVRFASAHCHQELPCLSPSS
jgi:predicted nuclease with RNAse H fold/dephospho-CoA kinase